MQGGLFDIAATGGAGRVDVDGDQRFGVIDDDGATGRQFHFPLVGRLDLRLDLEAREQRHFIGIQLDLLLVGRHHLADECQRLGVDVGTVDQHLANILAQVVAHGTDDDVGFAVDQKGRRALGGLGGDRFPHLHQVVQVPLQLFGAAANTGGAYDQAHLVGNCQLAHGILELAAVIAFDTPRYATCTRVVGHQYQKASGQADEGGQGGALVATLFLVYLNDDFLTLFQYFLDVRAARNILDEVFARDLFQRQKAVALGAKVDEGGFEGGFYPGDFAPVDIGFLLFACAGLDVQIVEALSVYQGDPQFFGLGRVNKHPFHVVSRSMSCRQTRSRRRTAVCCVLVLGAWLC